MQVVNAACILLFIPLFDKLIYPLFSKYLAKLCFKTEGNTPTQTYLSRQVRNAYKATAENRNWHVRDRLILRRRHRYRDRLGEDVPGSSWRGWRLNAHLKVGISQLSTSRMQPCSQCDASGRFIRGIHWNRRWEAILTARLVRAEGYFSAMNKSCILGMKYWSCKTSNLFL